MITNWELEHKGASLRVWMRAWSGEQAGNRWVHCAGSRSTSRENQLRKESTAQRFRRFREVSVYELRKELTWGRVWRDECSMLRKDCSMRCVIKRGWCLESQRKNLKDKAVSQPCKWHRKWQGCQREPVGHNDEGTHRIAVNDLIWMVSNNSRLPSEESGEIWIGKEGRGLSPVEAGKLRRSVMWSVRLRCSDCGVEARHVTGAMSWWRPIRGLGWGWWCRVIAVKGS